MTRAAERPTTADQDHDETWEQVNGETPDGVTTDALNLAHRASEKFPDLANRYRNFAGPVAIASGALIALAGVAVARRLRRGQKPDQILEEITPEEIENAATATSRHNRIWRMVRRIARRRYGTEAAAPDTSDES